MKKYIYKKGGGKREKKRVRKPDIDSGEERNRESEGVREIKKQRETKPRQRKRAEERH